MWFSSSIDDVLGYRKTADWFWVWNIQNPTTEERKKILSALFEYIL